MAFPHQPAPGFTTAYNISTCGHFGVESVPDCGQPFVFVFAEDVCHSNEPCSSTDSTWYADAIQGSTYDDPERLDTRVANLLTNAKQALTDSNEIAPFTQDEISSAATTDSIASLLLSSVGEQKALLNNLLNLAFINKLRGHIKGFAGRQKHQQFLAVCAKLIERAWAIATSNLRALQDSVVRLQRIATLNQTFSPISKAPADHVPALGAVELAVPRNAGAEGRAVLNCHLTSTALALAEQLRTQYMVYMLPVCFSGKGAASSKAHAMDDDLSAMLLRHQYAYVTDFGVRSTMRVGGNRALNRQGLKINTSRVSKPKHIQPVILPRPDLDALGIKYRRSPCMATGRDFYVDTRMILQRLEELYPASVEYPALSSKETAGLAALLNKFTIDASVFSKAVQIMPPEFPAFRDKKFLADRAGFHGKQGDLRDTLRQRPEGLAHLRQCFDIAESLFVDGRDWVGGTSSPSLADLEGVWSIAWILDDLQPPAKYFCRDSYPKVYGWRDRFRGAVRSAQARAPKPVSLKGSEAVPWILKAQYSEADSFVDSEDPLELAYGAIVDLFPTDGGGFTHRDRGVLVKLTKDEVAIKVQAPTGENVRIHAPRWSFRIQEVAIAAKLA